MKKMFLAIAAFSILSLMFIIPAPAQATQFKIGAAAMYDWWQPIFKKQHNGTSVNPLGLGFKNTMKGSFMLGPTFGVEFGSWRMDLTALFGLNRNTFKHSSYIWDFTVWNILYGPSIINQYVEVGDSKARRYDVDLKFAKRLHQLFNFNIGARFNYGDGEGSLMRFRPAVIDNIGEDEYHIWQVGPVIGVGFNYEIKGFRIYADANVIVNFGNNYLERKLVNPNFFPYLLPFKYDTGLMGFGFDMDAGVSYFIAPAHLLLGIGFRWVGVVCATLGDDGSVLDIGYKNGWASGKWDHFYGITFEVSFKF